MLGPIVRLEGSGAARPLEADFDPDHGLLALMTWDEAPVSIGLNYDDLVLIDATGDGIIRTVEVLFSYRLWRAASLPSMPPVTAPRSIRLLDVPAGNHEFDDVDISVEFDPNAGVGAVWFADAVGGEWQALSPTVAALVHHGRLHGLLFRIKEEGTTRILEAWQNESRRSH